MGSVQRFSAIALGLAALLVGAAGLLEIKRSGYWLEDHVIVDVDPKPPEIPTIVRQFSVLVTDTAGSPIDGAEIRVLAHPHESSHRGLQSLTAEVGRSGPDGRFVFQSLEEGAYQLVAAAPGFVETTIVKVEVGERQTDPLRISLPAGLMIRGTVYSADGDRVGGAKVTARLDREQWIEKSWSRTTRMTVVNTNSRGEFFFDTLCPGKFDVWASHPEYSSMNHHEEVEAGGGPIDLLFPAGIDVAGNVTEVDTTIPVAGATLSAVRANGVSRESFTDDAGYFQMKSLDPGTLTLNVRTAGHLPLEGVRLMLEGNGLERRQDFVLERAARIHGRVVDREGKGIRGARVKLGRGTPGSVSSTDLRLKETDDDGHFQWSDLEPGEWRVLTVLARGFLGAQGSSWRLAPGDSIALPEFVLGNGAAVEGKVVGPNGKGVPGVPIWLPAEQAPIATSDPDGSFFLSGLPSGTMDLVARPPEGPESVVRGIEVTEDRATAGVTIPLRRGAVLRGVVKDRENRPFRGAEVLVVDISESGMREVRTSSGPRGVFRLEGLRSRDTVDVMVGFPGYQQYYGEKIPLDGGTLQVMLSESATNGK